MFWITVLAMFIAAALVKLGVALVMVTILSAALWTTGAVLAVLTLFVIWRIRRR